MKWHPIAGPAGPGEPLALWVAGSEVARMVDRVGGGWFALLRYPGRPPVRRPCTSLEGGKAGCEAWAHRHRAVLERYGELQHLAWLASQTWRGDDAMNARAALQALQGKP